MLDIPSSLISVLPSHMTSALMGGNASASGGVCDIDDEFVTVENNIASDLYHNSWSTSCACGRSRCDYQNRVGTFITLTKNWDILWARSRFPFIGLVANLGTRGLGIVHTETGLGIMVDLAIRSMRVWIVTARIQCLTAFLACRLGRALNRDSLGAVLVVWLEAYTRTGCIRKEKAEADLRTLPVLAVGTMSMGIVGALLKALADGLTGRRGNGAGNCCNSGSEQSDETHDRFEYQNELQR